ncbi:MAG: hypothetical protein R3F31_22425 [Verrucomicrobiales bacterium]
MKYRLPDDWYLASVKAGLPTPNPDCDPAGERSGDRRGGKGGGGGGKKRNHDCRSRGMDRPI